MRDFSVLVKPCSGRCNMACTYCFYKELSRHRNKPDYGQMTEETAEVLIQKLVQTPSDSLTVAFQGGEPTLAGLPFYRKWIKLEEKYNPGIRIRHAIQTNGLLLDQEWAVFLRENHFLTGISLDGIGRIHDRYRYSAAGEKTFQTVTAHIAMLEKEQADCNILTVVTDELAGHVRKVYDFYKKKGYHYLQFIPCIPGEGAEEPLLHAGRYGEFLSALFDLWYEDVLQGKQPYIRNFENYITILLGMRPYACDQKGQCSNQFVIEADGSVFPCDFFVTDRYRMGNLLTDEIEEIRQRYRRQPPDYAGMRQESCDLCRYQVLCRGGCKRNYDGVRGNSLCEAYQAFFAYAGDRMELLARRIQENL